MPDFAISKPGPGRADAPAGFGVAAGRVPGVTVYHKFGVNESVSTTLAPVTVGAVYQMMQVAGAVTLRIKAGGHANDTSGGTGAREVTLMGLDETGAEVTETVATAGASASSATSATFIRLYRAYVSKTGTYNTAGIDSHDAAIVIEDSGGAADWATIAWATAQEGHGQTQIACYTVPLGKRGFIQNAFIQVDSTRPATVEFYIRENILETAAPYSPRRMQLEFVGLIGTIGFGPLTPLGPYAALTDLLWFAKVGTSTGGVMIDFEILLEST